MRTPPSSWAAPTVRLPHTAANNSAEMLYPPMTTTDSCEHEHVVENHSWGTGLRVQAQLPSTTLAQAPRARMAPPAPRKSTPCKASIAEVTRIVTQVLLWLRVWHQPKKNLTGSQQNPCVWGGGSLLVLCAKNETHALVFPRGAAHVSRGVLSCSYVSTYSSATNPPTTNCRCTVGYTGQVWRPA